MSERQKESDWPFEAWLRLAVLHLNLSPEIFWNMDVKDWLTLCKKDENTPLSSSDFKQLQTQFPDEVNADD